MLFTTPTSRRTTKRKTASKTRQPAKTERQRDAERKRKQRSAGTVVFVPPCEDPERRKRLEANDNAWLMYYFGPDCGLEDPYWYEFTDQQIQMQNAIADAIDFRDDQAIAASRGEGKTTLAERMIIKKILTGIIGFAVLVHATGGMAENSLDTIRTTLETNTRLAADYPEVCAPVIALENAPNRAKYVRVTGVRHDNGQPYTAAPAKFTWCGQEIIFPNVPGSPAARAIIATRGLDSTIRGLKKRGRRVDLVIIDDPDTEETARNPDQAKKIEDKIDRALAGLGSQQRRAGRVMLTTLQDRRSVSYKFTDPTQKSSWKGKRFAFMVKPPTRTDLWDEYVTLRDQELKDFAAGKSTDQHCRKSHAFYVEHLAEMELGAVIANPHRFDAQILPDGSQAELSALQRYYNEVARTSPEAVATEYDNNPPEDENATQHLFLTAHHIQHNCASGLDRRILPNDTVLLTVGGDVQKLGLHWAAVAWSETGAGTVVDYDFWEFRTANRPAADCELLILEGLHAWDEAQTAFPFTTVGGDQWEHDLGLIDAGWKEESWTGQPVTTFCSQAGYTRYLPSKGVSPYRRPRDSKRLVVGDNWHLAFPNKQSPLVETNADHWKLKVHEGFLSAPGEPGALTLFDSPRVDGRQNRTFHLSFSKHLLSETYESRFVPGFRGTRTGWWKSPKPNHWFDALYQAIAARSVRGLNILEAAAADSPAAAIAYAEPVHASPQITAGEPGRARW